MSDTTDGSLDLREQLIRIDRGRAETEKLLAEVRKLNAEALKFDRAETVKLLAEARKFDRDRGLAPWLAGGAVLGGVVTLASVILRALGVVP